MKVYVQIVCACVFAMTCCGNHIVGYKTEVSGGKTNIVTVSVKEAKMNESRTPKIGEEIVAPRVARPKLHIAELLSYVTVRLSCVRTDGRSLGTGFFYDIPHVMNEKLHIPVIVSNRHVVKDVVETIITLTLANDNSPTPNVYTVRINNQDFPWLGHPDVSVDLSVLPIAPVLRYMQERGKTPFFFALNASFVPDNDYLKSVTQTDEVIMIGYPGGLWDDVNNQPIFRKGILATSPCKNFGGRKEFLIDMPVFCGSSGSPVLLFSEGSFLDRRRGEGLNSIALGTRLKLLGINYATITSTVTGKVVPVPVPTVAEDNEVEINDRQVVVGQRFSLEAKMGIPNNIGIIINASCLKEIEEMFAKILRNLPTGDRVGHQ